MIGGIRNRLASERGFTLPEVLVVMVIIGLLAAIAYAVFLGQRTKAKDAGAKDNVAALAVEVEACRTDTEDFTLCDDATKFGKTGLPVDDQASLQPGCTSLGGMPVPISPPRKGMVAVISAERNCYVIEAQTQDGHFFWQWHRPDGVRKRACSPAGQGGCVADPATPGTVGLWTAPN